MEAISYAFEDGKVAAFYGDHLITSGEDFEKVAMTAEEYFSSLCKEHQKKVTESARKSATHITTPNGQKGEILGRTAGLWSDEITVRFDNNQIRRFATFVGDGLRYSQESPDLPQSPMEYFQRKLDKAYTPSRDGLLARLAELDQIRKGASNLVAQGTSLEDSSKLHQIVLTASAERNEVEEALEHVAASDAEAMVPPKRAYEAVEQADMGKTTSWLDVVASEMIAESEGQDLHQLMQEGPTMFVSALDTGALANASTVREMVTEHIHAKTAGFKGEAVEEYRDQFVARAEMARRQELSYRRDETADEMKREASAVQDTPDEAIFM